MRPTIILAKFVVVKVPRRHLTSGMLLIGIRGPGAASAKGCTCLFPLVVRTTVPTYKSWVLGVDRLVI